MQNIEKAKKEFEKVEEYIWNRWGPEGIEPVKFKEKNLIRPGSTFEEDLEHYVKTRNAKRDEERAKNPKTTKMLHYKRYERNKIQT